MCTFIAQHIQNNYTGECDNPERDYKIACITDARSTREHQFTIYRLGAKGGKMRAEQIFHKIRSKDTIQHVALWDPYFSECIM